MTRRRFNHSNCIFVLKKFRHLIKEAAQLIHPIQKGAHLHLLNQSNEIPKLIAAPV